MKVAEQSGSPRTLAVSVPIPAYDIAYYLDKSVGSASARVEAAFSARSKADA
jgi:hypothetical protein